MHTLIPYAAPPGAHCQDAINRLHLPQLARLLRALTPSTRLHGTPQDLTPIAERVQALAGGLDGPDGLVPWAAQEAYERGLVGLHGSSGWAWITPCHWTVHADHVEMSDPVHLALTAHDADQLLTAMRPYFAEDGITLFAPAEGHSHTRWLARGDTLAHLPTASLERVLGQTVDPWLPRLEAARGLRKLQNEMQMLLYTHVVNDQRAHFKLAPVNAFWVSGTGDLARAPHATPACSLRDALRVPAQKDDAADWANAWRALDNTTLAHEVQRLQAGQPVTLTLCGASAAVTLTHQPLSLWQRLERGVVAPSVHELLKSLCTS